MAKLISIITVTLNPPLPDLLSTVESVINQSYFDWELIIKDGGSTNESLRLLPNDSRIKITTKEDSGIFDAMNQGIQEASGRYICLLNAGDYFFDKDVLLKVTNLINENSNLDFIYGDVYKLQSRSRYEFYSNKLTKYFLFSSIVCHQSWFVSRQYYSSKGLYNTELTCGSDYEFFLRMVIKNNVNYFHISNVLVVYKGGGFSQQPNMVKFSKYALNSVRKTYFNNSERLFFRFFIILKNVIKNILYDKIKILQFFYKVYQTIKLRGQN